MNEGIQKESVVGPFNKIPTPTPVAVIGPSPAVWPDKNRQMSIKVAKNDFTRKMNDFDTFTKIA